MALGCSSGRSSYSMILTTPQAAQVPAPALESTHAGCVIMLYYLKASANAERIVYCMSEAAMLSTIACACSTVTTGFMAFSTIRCHARVQWPYIHVSLQLITFSESA